MSISYSPMGVQQNEMRMSSSSFQSYRKYLEESPVKSGKRFNNRSHFTPSSSPPNSSLFSPSHQRSRNLHSDESREDSNRSFDYGNRCGSTLHRNNALPIDSVDPLSGEITYSFDRILAEGSFEIFAKDKSGCHFLQEQYPEEGTTLRYRLFGMLENKEGLFEEMCKDVFANFFVQKMLEKSTMYEQRLIAMWISKSMFALCMNRYSCRVIQKAIEHLPDELKIPLLDELHKEDLVMLTVDQNANHVIQKIFHSFDLCYWSFIIISLLEEMFFSVVENKYGCRVVQLAIELLSEAKLEHISFENIAEAEMREKLLGKIMEKLIDNCERLSSNEFANYVIQHVITASSLAKYRDIIIEKCLLGKLLSMSQEKYASHVVEKALEHASSPMLREMMDEIFDGYVPHPETKKDALDILLFHQFGNYVIQRKLIICSSKTEYRLDDRIREQWLARLEDRINRCTGKLMRYSSGKKILDMLRAARGQPPINHGIGLSSPRHKLSSTNNHHHHHHHSHSNNTSFNGLRVPDLYR
ncbi:hypothetical protein PRIPAC_89015 [Pristionchus pacificus]|uniref:Puf-11 n=1 Tax=Pristionchus pacificus TaxID=54126 RepID=A0A2A6D3A0_PRIPA|nr:hypothetical protein PRIPAC_89015 [Pristionchus pacificus]|eukprot:PDM84924.1 puf-11 [Pristionchus pacificus]